MESLKAGQPWQIDESLFIHLVPTGGWIQLSLHIEAQANVPSCFPFLKAVKCRCGGLEPSSPKQHRLIFLIFCKFFHDLWLEGWPLQLRWFLLGPRDEATRKDLGIFRHNSPPSAEKNKQHHGNLRGPPWQQLSPTFETATAEPHRTRRQNAPRSMVEVLLEPHHGLRVEMGDGSCNKNQVSHRKKKNGHDIPWNIGCLIGILILVYHVPLLGSA